MGGEGGEDLVESKGFLSLAEVSAGAVAKADQNKCPNLARMLLIFFLVGLKEGCTPIFSFLAYLEVEVL